MNCALTFSYSLSLKYVTQYYCFSKPLFICFSDWFPTHLPDIIDFLTAEVSRAKVTSLVVSTPFPVTDPNELEADGIHLKKVVGDRFLSHITQCVTSESASLADDTLMDDDKSSASSDESVVVAVTAPNPEDPLSAILRIVQGNSVKLNVVRPLKKSFEKLAESTSALETQVRLRRKQDNLIFARIKEETDAETNRSREDRVVISGLERAPGRLSTHASKKEHYSGVVKHLIDVACPSVNPPPAILDVLVTLRKEQAKPTIEVRLDSVAGALAFRKAASTLAKDKEKTANEFSSLFFSNSVTQATRVRIEILREIAKKLTTETETSFVHGFVSRPVLRYEVKEGAASYCSGTGRSYNFVDAVSRYGELLQAADLAPAYRRAGQTFRGAMEQYFVLLSDSGISTPDNVNLQPIGTRGRRGGIRGRSLFGRAGVKRSDPWGDQDQPTPKKTNT